VGCEPGDGSYSGSLPELRDLSRELREIAGALEILADLEAQRDRAIVYQVSISAPCVHTILFVRRLRTQFLGFEVPEPAWGMMLAILAVRLDGGRLSLDELSNASGMSRRTAERWVRRMEKEGFLQVHRQPEAGRKALVDLTEQAADLVKNYLDAALQISPWLL
jgi:biotin operon repressor